MRFLSVSPASHFPLRPASVRAGKPFLFPPTPGFPSQPSFESRDHGPPFYPLGFGRANLPRFPRSDGKVCLARHRKPILFFFFLVSPSFTPSFPSPAKGEKGSPLPSEYRPASPSTPPSYRVFSPAPVWPFFFFPLKGVPSFLDRTANSRSSLKLFLSVPPPSGKLLLSSFFFKPPP